MNQLKEYDYVQCENKEQRQVLRDLVTGLGYTVCTGGGFALQFTYYNLENDAEFTEFSNSGETKLPQPEFIAKLLGKWVEPRDPIIKIGTDEVKFDDKGQSVKVGCTQIDYATIQQIQEHCKKLQEPKKKLSDLGEKDVVHCPTKELAEKFRKLMHEAGMTWQVSGNALVSGDAWVSGNAWVGGNTWVRGDAWVCGNARVSGNAQVYGYARGYENAQVREDVPVYGNFYLR